MSLHPIDNPSSRQAYSDEELDKFMVFCLLDRAMPYEKVCKVFDWIDRLGLTTRKGIRDSGYSIQELALALHTKGESHRFPNTTARFLYQFGRNRIDLRRATREEIVDHVLGMGYKLASMYLRNTRGEKYAVLDIHVRRWLAEKGIKGKNYKDLEAKFLVKCKELGQSPYDLDLKIWQERRIGNRKGKK